jgi:DnaJ-class molecular chaperone
MPDFYQILGLARSATNAEVRQAYTKLAREQHPDRFSDATQKERAQEVFKQLTAAFNALSNERERKEYDRSLERPSATTPEEMAREAYELGQELFGVGDYGEAAAQFRAAVHRAPNEARYQAALGKALAKSPQTSHEAVDAFERAVRLQPQSVALHVELAALLLRQGLRIRAKKVVEAALQLAPDNPHVRTLAEELDLGSGSGEGGSLKGFLRRKP